MECAERYAAVAAAEPRHRQMDELGARLGGLEKNFPDTAVDTVDAVPGWPSPQGAA